MGKIKISLSLLLILTTSVMSMEKSDNKHFNLNVFAKQKSVKYDFNGDGKADILWKKDKYYSLWYMNASGSHKYKYIGKKYAPYEVAGVADFNGDGKADILWKKDKYYSLWYMNANGSHKYKYIGKKSSPYEVASVADFNGDGKVDILWKKDKYYSLWYMNANGSHKYKYIGKKSSPYEVASVADFNGDGKADILWKKDKYYSFWYMNASGSHKYKYIGKKSSPYEVASVADFNGDGKADILWKKDKYYSFWYMNASGSHKYKYIGKKSSPYEVASVADFNGDGKADILWKKDKYYSLWYMNASGSHKYKYIGKKYAPYEVASNRFISSEVPLISVSSKLFLNGNENTTSISKTVNNGSAIEGVKLGFKPVANMMGGVSFSLKFKNGGFDISNYYPALCIGKQSVGYIFSFGNEDDYISYNPTFKLYSDIPISKNSLISFHKSNCNNNDAQPIRTASSKNVVIEAKITNALDEQGSSIKDFNTNSVKIKITVKAEEQNQIPTVDAGEDKTVTVNESVTLYGSGSDAEGSVTFEWKKGNSVLGTDATLTYTPTIVGTDTLTLTVTDNDGVTASDSVDVVVEDSNEDNPFDDIKK